MLKNKKTVYFCQECGYESAKWMGQCPACKAWNTFVEETVSSKKSASSNAKISQKKTEPVILRDISLSATNAKVVGSVNWTGCWEEELFLAPSFKWAEILESESLHYCFRFAGTFLHRACLYYIFPVENFAPD